MSLPNLMPLLRVPGFPVLASLACLALALPLRAEPPPALTEFIKQKALPLKTIEPGSGFDDLQALKPLIGDARMVALGECTHGTKEIFKAKHRLLEYLASEMGFSLFAIEANMTEAHRLNAYVQGGEGNPDDLIRGMGFWTWSTLEVRDMVEWMRRYNADPANRAAGKNVAFEGFDMQSPDAPAQAALAYARGRDAQLGDELAKAVDALVTAAPQEPFGFANGYLNPERLRGKHVVFSGWIRTENLKEGWAGLWLRADTPAQVGATFDNMQGGGPSGTTGWRRYEIVMDIPADASAISFGMIMTGKGKAWFDDLQLSVAGVPIDEGDSYDFSFDEGNLLGFPKVANKNYVVSCVPESHQGKKALLIRSNEDTLGANASLALPLWQTCLDKLLKLEPSDTSDGEQLAWARRNARVVVQALELKLGKAKRDEAMAENALWLLDRVPGRKMVIWAHDGHIAKASDAMGGALFGTLGSNYRPLAFALGAGEYRAVGRGKGGLNVFPLAPSAPVSSEAALASAALPFFILDLRIAPDDTGSVLHWFDERRPHRLIGSMEMRGASQFQPRRLSKEFDLVLWIAQSTASQQLPAPATK